MNRSFGQTPPVSEGEEIDVLIDDVGEKGDGIARVKGFVLFVAGTQRGDEVRVKITKVLPKVGFAEVVGKAETKPVSDKPAEEPAKDAPKEDVEEYDDSQDTEDFGEE
ncbi:TRAM domain-containing protein [Nanoarchaeota archaeon]